MSYSSQVDKSHYEGQAYRSGERWASYYHQLSLIDSVHPKTVLEVGLGEGVVARELINRGISVTTLDVAEDLKPDVLGSVTNIPLPDASYDAVLACEILEHISFEDVPKALGEIARVSKQYAIISVPHPGYVFSIRFKLPLLPYVAGVIQIPFFWKTHVFNGEHYWELGKKGYSISRFVDSAKKAGLVLVRIEKHVDDPGHRFFLFRKK